ncbi:MAG: DNA starvation/stationary phase protection protein Dps [Ectothiorhodospiraceae bacterium]|nr:DNA starvation/stationary phase protection protein Dps [Ectothiorhodospiraceae bacterium]
MYATRNDLSHNVRREMGDLLNARLADAVVLASHAKQAHWNVRGPGFTGLHALFDQVHAEVGTYVDDIAERAVALGVPAVGTVEAAAEASVIAPYPRDANGGEAHVDALAGSLATFARESRAAIETADRAGDAVTADLFTGVVKGADKLLWMVEAHQG